MIFYVKNCRAKCAFVTLGTMELTLDQALQKGIEAHKAGMVQEADQYYTAILKANPKHPDANHNMGILAIGVGKVGESLPFFKTALEVNPSIPQYWLSYIDALVNLNRIEDAKNVFAQAKSKGIKGDEFDQLENRLRRVAQNEGEKEIHKDKSTQSNILNELKLDKALRLANKKVKDGLSEEAKKIYQDILKKFPKNKKSLEGIKALCQISTTKRLKNHEPPQNELGPIISLFGQGHYREVQEKIFTLLKRFPHSFNLYNILGATYTALEKLDEAIASYDNAICINPTSVDAWLNGAETLEKWNRIDHLKTWLDKAFNAFKTVYADLRLIKVKLLLRERNYEEATSAISKINFKTVTEARKQTYLILKAKCYEKSKEFDLAYEYFKKSNSLKKNLRNI